MRHALITIHLLHQARDADERLEHHPRAEARTRPAEPGRLAAVVSLTRRVRALAARTA